MCTQKPPHDYSAELYSRYGLAFSAYITERVLPALRGHSGEFLLNELWQRWANHKLMVRWLSRFFNYLDRYYIARHTMHPLPEVGLMRFRDEVYSRVKLPAKEALLAAVANERAGEGVNRPLLKNVLSIFIEVGMGSMDCYQRDFEASLVEATKEHYARVAAAWVRKKKFFFGFFFPVRPLFFSFFFLCFSRSLQISKLQTKPTPGRGRLLPRVHGQGRGRPPLRGGARRRLPARVVALEVDGGCGAGAAGVARRDAAQQGRVGRLQPAGGREARRPGEDVQAVRARAEGAGPGGGGVQGARGR